MPVVPVVPQITQGVVPTSQLAAITAAVTFLMNRPTARLRRSVNQTITTGVFTDVGFDIEEIDNVNGHDNVTNNTRYVAQYSGRCLVLYHGAFAANATGIRAARLAVNGAALPASNNVLATASAASGSHFTGGVRTFLTAGDIVTLQVFQSSGGNLDQEVAADAGPYLDITWEGLQ